MEIIAKGKTDGKRPPVLDEQDSVLVVEDDFANRYLCEALLRDAGLAVSSAASFREAQERLRARRYSLLLLDLGLPDGDGLELMNTWGVSRPALIMTIHGEPEERARGLRSGAVDYLLKPFHPDELRMRVQRALANSTSGLATGNGELRWDAFRLDVARRRIHAPGGRVVELTAGETEVLRYLMRRRGAVVPTAVLADAVAVGVGNNKTVSVLVSRLRKKFRANGVTGLEILAIHGSGYYLAEAGG